MKDQIHIWSYHKLCPDFFKERTLSSNTESGHLVVLVFAFSSFEESVQSVRFVMAKVQRIESLPLVDSDTVAVCHPLPRLATV